MAVAGRKRRTAVKADYPFLLGTTLIERNPVTLTRIWRPENSSAGYSGAFSYSANQTEDGGLQMIVGLALG
jgi:hypothetical protein